MRTIISVFLLVTGMMTLYSQEAEIFVRVQDHWPPGKVVPVTVEIVKGEAEDFARLFHSFPTGFSVENVNSGGGDFFWDNNQVNYVWTDLPDDKVIRVQYLARADQLLAGTFSLQLRFDYVLDSKERKSVYSDDIFIVLDRDAIVENTYLEPVTDPGKEVSELKAEEEKMIEGKAEIEKKEEVLDFRIQVSIASSRFSQEELEERINCKLKHGMKVLKTGSMYKYQSGSFKSYDMAADYLKELRSYGVEDAFIVAFRNNVQISIKEAQEIIGNR